MKIRQTFLFEALLLIGLAAKAQNSIGVASFRLLDTDLTANLQGTKRIDQNGHTAALIKVVTTQTGFTFDVGVMGIVDTQQKAGEIWVWVPFGVKHLNIGHPTLGFLRDYRFPCSIEEARTYELVLISGRVNPIIDEDLGGQYLVMNVEPKNALVYIDEELKTIEEGEASFLLSYGKHTYRVEAPGYMNEAGMAEIGKERVEINIRLVSSKATLTVSCADTDADIFINDQKKGRGSWTGQLADGMYAVEARKASHRTVKKSLTLAKQEQKTLALDAPEPICGKLNLTSTPSNCEVYLDGKQIGKSPDLFANILVGSHNVELRKNGYESQRQKVDIEEGKITDFSMTLARIGAAAQQPQVQQPEAKPQPQQNEKPAKPVKPAPVRQTFIMANAAYSTAPQTSFGLTFGQVKEEAGWYVSFMSNFNFSRGDFECDDDGYPIDISFDNSYTMMGESTTSRLNITAGLMLCNLPLCLYAGAGYGQRTLLWKYDGGYATNNPHSFKGLALDAGAMLHFKGFSLSAGATSVGFGYWEAKLGIGYNF